MSRFPLVLILSLPVQVWAQSEGRPGQRAGDCSVNVAGIANTATLVCTSVDRRLADQLRTLLATTGTNTDAIRSLLEKVVTMMADQTALASQSTIASQITADATKDLAEASKITADATKDLAEASKITADATKDIMEANRASDQRAKNSFEAATKATLTPAAMAIPTPFPWDGASRLSVSTDYKNVGHSAAFGVAARTRIFYKKYPLEPLTESAPATIPEGSWFLDQGSSMSFTNSFTLGPEIIPFLNDGTYAVVFLSTVGYLDVFGVSHTTTLCAFWHKPTVESPGGGMAYCPSTVFAPQIK